MEYTITETKTISREDIVNALNILKAVCERDDGSCNYCELYNEKSGCCGVKYENPCDWNVVDESKPWRALR